MKTIFIPAFRKTNNSINIKEKLPKNIFITYSIQYKQIAEQIKSQLSKTYNIKGFKQVLGCTKINSSCKDFLLIGSGRFHALNLLKQGKQVHVLDIETNKLTKLSQKERQNYENKKRGALMTYFNSDEFGIIISTKPGQENLKKALELKSRSKKKAYLFLTNTINNNEFENFQLKSWVNTACPGLTNDYSILNSSDLSN